jgi:hypothetical protein
MDKIRGLKKMPARASIYVVANLLTPFVRGWQNYYSQFIEGDLKSQQKV